MSIVSYTDGGDHMENYRERLRNIREDRDLTQAEIGKLLNKSQQGYNHIEAGRAELKIDDLIKLCKFYNLSADYIIGLTNKKTSYKWTVLSASRESTVFYNKSFITSIHRAQGLVCIFCFAEN